ALIIAVAEIKNLRCCPGWLQVLSCRGPQKAEASRTQVTGETVARSRAASADPLQISCLVTQCPLFGGKADIARAGTPRPERKVATRPSLTALIGHAEDKKNGVAGYKLMTERRGGLSGFHSRGSRF